MRGSLHSLLCLDVFVISMCSFNKLGVFSFNPHSRICFFVVDFREREIERNISQIPPIHAPTEGQTHNQIVCIF